MVQCKLDGRLSKGERERFFEVARSIGAKACLTTNDHLEGLPRHIAPVE